MRLVLCLNGMMMYKSPFAFFIINIQISGFIALININVMQLEVVDNLTMLFGKAGAIVVAVY